MTVTPYVPGVVELKVHDAGTVALAVRLTGAGQVTVRPVIGLTVGVRVTVPTKFWVPVRVTDIEAPVAPLLKFTGVTAEIVKSPTWTVTEARCEAEPGEPEPVMVTP